MSLLILYLPSFFNFLGKTHFLKLVSYFNVYLLFFKYGAPPNYYVKIELLFQNRTLISKQETYPKGTSPWISMDSINLYVLLRAIMLLRAITYYYMLLGETVWCCMTPIGSLGKASNLGAWITHAGKRRMSFPRQSRFALMSGSSY